MTSQTDILSFEEQVLLAARQAAEAARQIAIKTGTRLVIMKDGRVQHVDPHDVSPGPTPAKPIGDGPYH